MLKTKEMKLRELVMAELARAESFGIKIEFGMSPSAIEAVIGKKAWRQVKRKKTRLVGIEDTRVRAVVEQFCGENLELTEAATQADLF